MFSFFQRLLVKRLYGIFLTLTLVRFNFTLKQEKLINIVIDHALQQWSFSGPVKPNELAKPGQSGT